MTARRYTIPPGYEEVEAIAVGDYVFHVFGIDECYHSGPFAVAGISQPRIVTQAELSPFLPDRSNLIGREVCSIALAWCDDSPDWMQRQRREQGWVNDLHKVDGIVKTPGGRILVKRQGRAPLVQATLFSTDQGR